MFNMQEVGRKIAKKRKEKNMTQMELADAMGVSFQAVSNWERGNSMPDIAKLPELAGVLDLSIDELLTNEKSARLVRHILSGDAKEYLEKEPVAPDIAADVAPLLKPSEAEPLLETVLASSAEKVSLRDLIQLAPFVSEEFLHQWAMGVDAVENIGELAGLAPFLSEETLDALAERLTANVELPELTALAPFLSDQTLNRLAERASRKENLSVREIIPVAPFLSEEALDKLAAAAVKGGRAEELVPLAPFLSKSTLKRCAADLMQNADLKTIVQLAPFL